MAAIIRVKRRYNEDPAQALLLACKKSRIDNNNQEKNIDTNAKALFKFAATVSNQEKNIETHIRSAIRKEKLSKEYKNHYQCASEHTQLKLSQKLNSSLKNRYKVISQKRAADLSTLSKQELESNKENLAQHSNDTAQPLQKSSHPSQEAAEASQLQYRLLDVIPDSLYKDRSLEAPTEVITCNGQPMVRHKLKAPAVSPCKYQSDSEVEQYVYDLYYNNKAGVDFRSMEEIEYIESNAPEELLLYGSDEEDDAEQQMGEDEDSNDESNWRNDYPDEDFHFCDDRGLDYFSDPEEYYGHTHLDPSPCLEDLVKERLIIHDDHQETSLTEEERELWHTRFMKQLADSTDSDDDTDNSSESYGSHCESDGETSETNNTEHDDNYADTEVSCDKET